MNTRRNAEEENVNELVPLQDPQNPEVLIKEGAMSNIEIRLVIQILTHVGYTSG